LQELGELNRPAGDFSLEWFPDGFLESLYELFVLVSSNKDDGPTDLPSMEVESWVVLDT
jgi:hypothetical protein